MKSKLSRHKRKETWRIHKITQHSFHSLTLQSHNQPERHQQSGQLIMRKTKQKQIQQIFWQRSNSKKTNHKANSINRKASKTQDYNYHLDIVIRFIQQIKNT